jgi:hypothetical protein
MHTGESSETREQYWQAQVEAWRASGQTQQAFCRANDLNYPRFGYWLRKFRRQGGSEPRRAPGFVPVIGTSGEGGLSVHLPNGIELRGVSEQNLHVAAQLLARL